MESAVVRIRELHDREGLDTQRAVGDGRPGAWKEKLSSVEAGEKPFGLRELVCEGICEGYASDEEEMLVGAVGREACRSIGGAERRTAVGGWCKRMWCGGLAKSDWRKEGHPPKQRESRRRQQCRAVLQR